MKAQFTAILLLTLLMLLAVLTSGSAQQPTSQVYIVVLSDQEQLTVAEQVQQQYQLRQIMLKDELKRIESEITKFDRQDLEEPSQPIPPTDQYIPPELLALRTQVIVEQASLRDQMRREILDLSAASRRASQQQVAKMVTGLGGEIVYAYQSFNALAIRLSTEKVATLQNGAGVLFVYEDRLFESQMDVSAYAIDADKFWSSGFQGGGVDVAVIDTGIDHLHPALSAQSYRGKRCLQIAQSIYPSLATTDPSDDDVHGHGTHIAGTIASTNSTYRGVAYGLNTLINGKAGFDTGGGGASMYFSDAMSCIDWALTGIPEGADVISYSFGGSTTVDDGDFERFWDAVVSQMSALAVISAGNSGPAAYTLTSPCIAYNSICVANIDDRNTTARSDDLIASSSSRGPTVNGRKKPDLTAPGTNITSTYNKWENSSDYISMSGTSMAAPHISAAAALIMGRGVSDPLAVKALLINNAQDRGTAGWDNAYGWGYIDLGDVNGHVNDTFSGSIQARPAYHLYAGPALNGEAVTLVWNRRAIYQANNYPTTYFGLSDLDLYAYNASNNASLGNSISAIDNVEQVRFGADYPQVVVKVDAYSGLIQGATQEAYAMATGNGFNLHAGPSLQILQSTRGDLQASSGSEIIVNLSVKNTGDMKAHNIQLNITYSAGLSLQSGPSLPASVSSLAPGEVSATYSWEFVKTNDNAQSLAFQATSSSYGETFSTNATFLKNNNLYFPLIVVQ